MIYFYYSIWILFTLLYFNECYLIARIDGARNESFASIEMQKENNDTITYMQE